MVSEPRRSGMVPSSTTVTPLAATCCPMRPENAELPLRLKSPSRPWPIASCSRMPSQPEAEHHGHGAGRGGRCVEIHARLVHRRARKVLQPLVGGNR